MDTSNDVNIRVFVTYIKLYCKYLIILLFKIHYAFILTVF